MMISIFNKKLFGVVEAISSKSFVHRAIICSALANEKTKIFVNEFSQDILATIESAKSIGSRVVVANNYIEVFPIDYVNRKNSEIYCNESGTTYRFMLPIASSLYDLNTFIIEGSLGKRPIKDLTDILIQNGSSILGENPLTISGKFNFSDVSIRGNISSQYISALLLASVLQDKDVKINIIGKVESLPYIELTLDIMNKFKIDIENNDNVYFIKKNQNYISPKKIISEGDWSNAAFFLVAGALSEHGIEIFGLDRCSKQGDKEILNILSEFGAYVEQREDSIFVKKQNAKPLDIDISQTPDLAPILAVLLCSAEGISKLINIGRLKFKESDRVKTTIDLISNLGGNISEIGNSIIINGSGNLLGGNINSYNDHRIAMSGAIASTISTNNVNIKGYDAVNKSYPNFFNDFKKLGGEYVIYNG